MRASVCSGFGLALALDVRSMTCSFAAVMSHTSSNTDCHFASMRMAASTTTGLRSPFARASSMSSRMRC